MKQFPQVPRGEFQVLTTNGERSVHKYVGKPATGKILKEHLGDVLPQFISLTMHPHHLVMAIDDDGKGKDLPVNEEATSLMKLKNGPDYPNKIHGVAVLLNDDDFEE